MEPEPEPLSLSIPQQPPNLHYGFLWPPGAHTIPFPMLLPEGAGHSCLATIPSSPVWTETPSSPGSQVLRASSSSASFSQNKNFGACPPPIPTVKAWTGSSMMKRLSECQELGVGCRTIDTKRGRQTHMDTIGRVKKMPNTSVLHVALMVFTPDGQCG